MTAAASSLFQVHRNNSNVISASSFAGNAFRLENTSAAGVTLDRLVLRLGTDDTVPDWLTLLPNVVFDPATDTDGQPAGNTLAKDFTRDDGSEGSFAVAATLTGAFEGGYRVLTLEFSGFDPGEKLGFSIDIDPTSTKEAGGPGSAELAGKVGGFELAGALVTATYSDGTTHAAELFTDGSISGVEAHLRDGLVAAPTVSVAGVGTGPATVTALTQEVTIAGGPAGGRVRLSLLESQQIVTPGNGYVFDPYETNQGIATRHQIVTLDADGSWTGTVTLSDGPEPNDGVNHLLAAVIDPAGNIASLVSDIVVLAVAQASNAPPVVAMPLADRKILLGEAFGFSVPSTTFGDADEDALMLTAAGLPSGVRFDAGTGTFSGQPASSGVFAIAVTASDGSASATDAFTLSVAVGLTAGRDRSAGGGGADVVDGLAGADRLGGAGGNDALWGGGDADTVAGGGGSDSLFGEAGTDVLNGGKGGDTLVGGAGADTLTGGTGADLFLWADPSEGADVLADFASGLDRVGLSAAGFGGGLAAGNALASGGRFAANANGAATEALAQLLYATDTGALLWDPDGTGAAGAVTLAVLGAGVTLSATDVVVLA